MTTMIGAQAQSSCGGTLVSIDGRTLPLRDVEIVASARGGLAQVTLRQRFVNDGPDPLRVIYKVPLPADAAVGGFEFTFGDERVVGEVRGRDQAREDFENAIIEGRTAGLLEEERTSVFTQELGNVPPRTEVVCSITLDQKLRWLEDGAWEWRFPTVIPPRYMGEPGRVPDVDRTSVTVTKDDHPVRAACRLDIREPFAALPESPTHRIDVSSTKPGAVVRLADERGVRLDRDIAIRWPAASTEVGLSIDVACAPASVDLRDAYALLTIVPPSPEAPMTPLPRDVCLLIDTSGSMSDRPLELAKGVATGIVNSLGERDTLEMIEFSMKPRRWDAKAVFATSDARRAAASWIDELEAWGGTEMQSAFIEAMNSHRADAQRQVILITDGFIGFERDVASIARRLAMRDGCRVHAVGVGSAPNRTLTGEVARAGGGQEFIVGLDEDPTDAAAKVVARTARPLCTNLRIEGDAVLEASSEILPDLLAGAPALIPLRIDADGGPLTVSGRVAGAEWRHEINVPACGAGEGKRSLPRLFGRERVTELDATGAPGESLDHEIECIGLAYGIATRCTSWVAISESVTVDPKKPTRREVVPQAMAAGLSAEGLGLRSQMDMHLSGRHRAFQQMADGKRSMSESCLRELIDFSLADAGWSERRDMAPQPSADTHQHSGRLVLADDNRAVIEFKAPSRFNWRPASVETSDGDAADIDPEATTQHGKYRRGKIVRLVLTGIDGRTLVGKHLTITMDDGEEFTIEVQRA